MGASLDLRVRPERVELMAFPDETEILDYLVDEETKETKGQAEKMVEREARESRDQ